MRRKLFSQENEERKNCRLASLTQASPQATPRRELRRSGQAIAVFGRGLVWDKSAARWRLPSFSQEKAESFSTGDQLCLLVAAHLFKEYEAAIMLVCGGVPQSPSGRADIPALAQVMKDELMALGVGGQDIETDERPCFLLEQLACLQEMLVRNGAGGATLIVNRYCLARTRLLLKKCRDLTYLRQLAKSRALQVLAAEDIAPKFDPRWEAVIKAVYRSAAMKGLIAWEREARRVFKKGE